MFEFHIGGEQRAHNKGNELFFFYRNSLIGEVLINN